MGATDSATTVRDRRGFLRAGGVGVLAAAVAACSKKDVVVSTPIKAQQTGQAPTTNPDRAPPTVPGKPPAKADEQADLANLRTATSLEFAAINAYDALLSKVSVDAGPAFNGLAARLKSHHGDAVRTLQDATAAHLEEVKRGPNRDAFAPLKEDRIVYTPGRLTDEKGKPDAEGNATFWKTFVEPGLEAISEANDVIDFARRMENVLTATHVLNTSTLTTITLRRTAMAIGSVEARHSALLALLKNPAEPGAPNSVFYTRDGAGASDLLTFDGSAAPPTAK